MSDARKRNLRSGEVEYIPYKGPFYLTTEEMARVDAYFARNRKAMRCYEMGEWLVNGLAKAEAKECVEAKELRARMAKARKGGAAA